jgi:hypothetical protein
VREDADLDIIVDQLWGACYYWLLVLRVPLEDSLVERLIGQALRGDMTVRRAVTAQPGDRGSPGDSAISRSAASMIDSTAADAAAGSPAATASTMAR